jgi:exodeoxyribonuclease VII large subunit
MDTVQAKVKLKLLAKSKQLEGLKPINQIRAYKEKFAQMDKGIKNGTLSQIYQRKILLDRGAVFQKIDQKIVQDIRQKKNKFEMLSSHLKAVNPKNLLDKGYCILFSEKKDSVILTANDVSVNQNINILMKDGELFAEINRKQ